MSTDTVKFSKLFENAVLKVQVVIAGETHAYEFPATSTVDHVKYEIFKRTPTLKGKELNDYFLALNEDDVLHVEFVKLVWSHEQIHNAFLGETPVQLQLQPRDKFELYGGKKGSSVRPAGSRRDPPKPADNLSTTKPTTTAPDTVDVILSDFTSRLDKLFDDAKSTLTAAEEAAIGEKLRRLNGNKDNMVEAQVSLNDGTTVFLTLPHRHIPETEGAVSAAQHLQNDAIAHLEKVLEALRKGAGEARLLRKAELSSLPAEDDVKPTNGHSDSADAEAEQVIEVQHASGDRAAAVDGGELEQAKARPALMTSSSSFPSLPSIFDDRPLAGTPQPFRKYGARDRAGSPTGNQLPQQRQPATGSGGSIPLTSQRSRKESSPTARRRPALALGSSGTIPPEETNGRLKSTYFNPQVRKIALGSQRTSRMEKLRNIQIGSLIGKPLGWTSGEEEVRDFRAKMARLFDFDNWELGEKGFANIQQVSGTNFELPLAAEQVRVKLHFPSGSLVRTLLCSADDTVYDLVATGLSSVKIRQAMSISGEVGDYLVKICGYSWYILNLDTKLRSVDYVRESIKRNKEVEFVLVERSSFKRTDLQELVYLDHFQDVDLGMDTEPFDDDEDPSLAGGFGEKKHIPLSEIKRNFELRVICLEDADFGEVPAMQQLPKGVPVHFYVSAALYHGGESLAPEMKTTATPSMLWCQWLRLNLQMCQIPKATRLCLSLMGVNPNDGSEFPLGWVNLNLVDYNGNLRMGVTSLNLWPGEKANPIGTCVPNYKSKNPIKLIVELYKFPHVVKYKRPILVAPAYEDNPYPRAPERKRLVHIISQDSLHMPSSEEKKLLWEYRRTLAPNPKALAKVLMAINWSRPEDVAEAHRMLTYWTPLSPIEALELLDAYFADEVVREYAVAKLCQLSLDELQAYLPQLTQVLKYEPYHDSALARFLLAAAFRHRPTIGHFFFWHLQAELQVPDISERYSLLLEVYLRGCGQQREGLLKQMEVSSKLGRIANLMKPLPFKERKQALQNELVAAGLPSHFILPMNPALEARDLNCDECKTLESFTAPLFLSFDNNDPAGSPFKVIFKAGDDLRQDILILQMFGIMDRLWKKHGLDLHMTLYGCTATGEAAGFIEVVPDCETTASIQKKAGGASAVFKDSVLTNWLKKYNPQEDQWAGVEDNFIRSCAGYCVATYVLGIGDRHNDNIMVTYSGHLFHIDFAHFLGNMMEWKGFKRETAPFVFTPQFLHVMGGEKGAGFQRFVSLSCLAYNIIRRYAHVIMILFQLMLSTGIKELKGVEDLHYLREVLALNMSDEKAAEYFTTKIYESLKTKRTQFNDAIHILANNKKNE